MIRKLYPWLIALTVMMAGVLAACGGRTETPTPPATIPPSGPTLTPAADVPPSGPTLTPAADVPPSEPTLTPAAAVPSEPTFTPSAAPVADGATLLRERCATCHGLDRVESARKTAEEWGRTVDRMIRRGAQLTDAERAVLVEYLAAHYR